MKLKLLQFFLVSILLYPITYPLQPTLAFASSFDIGIYPPLIQIRAKPKINVQTPITLENFSSESVDLNFQIKPFTASNKENGEITYLTKNQISLEAKSIMENIKLLDNKEQIKTITLAPHQKRTFTLNLEIPEKVLQSDYYLSLIFQTMNKQSEKKTNSSTIQAGISTNLILTVGTINSAQVEITEFSTPFFLASGPVPFTVRIKNIGKNVFRPTGSILIKNMFGQLVGKVDLLPVNILANTTRVIPDAVSLFSDPKTYTNSWKEKFIFGFYNATLIVSTDNNHFINKNTYFLSFPLHYIIIFTTLIILFFIVKNRIQKRM